jgi:hypothetical protein
MINLELPQINVLSKIDLLKDYETELDFPLSFYKNPNEYERLNEVIDDANLNPKFKKLNKLICEFVVDYSLVSFNVLDVKNQRHLNKLSSLIDKANGFIYANLGKVNDEKYLEIRDTIAKNDMEYDSDDEYL